MKQKQKMKAERKERYIMANFALDKRTGERLEFLAKITGLGKTKWLRREIDAAYEKWMAAHA